MSQRWVCNRLKALGLAANGYGTSASRLKRSMAASSATAIRRLKEARPTVELVFPVESGPPVGSLCGYLLFAGLCRADWPIHGETAYQVLGIGNRLLVRCPEDRVPALLGGKRRIRVTRETVVFGDPFSCSPQPSRRLESRLVVVKNATDAPAMSLAVRARLDALAVDGGPTIEIGNRGVLRINGKLIVGYAVRIVGLTARASLFVQAKGIGGRQRFGCGVFTPC